jgi:predicted DCC family thiol-disulfide oxidoreductase YuxK
MSGPFCLLSVADARPKSLIRIMAKDSTIPPAPVVLYDGDCGLCHRGVAFILRHERGPTLRFAALNSPYAVAAFAKNGIPKQSPDTMVVLDGTEIRDRSDAALFIAAHLRAPWRWLRILRFVPVRLRDALYDFVARCRYRWFAKPESACPTPDAETRGRFL